MGTKTRPMDTTQRRRFPRYSFPIQVAIKWGSATIEAATRNIGLGGMFIETPEVLWLRAEFRARLSLPEPIELDCVVKCIEPTRGMGVEFKDLAEVKRQKLESLLASLTEK